MFIKDKKYSKIIVYAFNYSSIVLENKIVMCEQFCKDNNIQSNDYSVVKIDGSSSDNIESFIMAVPKNALIICDSLLDMGNNIHQILDNSCFLKNKTIDIYFLRNLHMKCYMQIINSENIESINLIIKVLNTCENREKKQMKIGDNSNYNTRRQNYIVDSNNNFRNRNTHFQEKRNFAENRRDTFPQNNFHSRFSQNSQRQQGSFRQQKYNIKPRDFNSRKK